MKLSSKLLWFISLSVIAINKPAISATISHKLPNGLIATAEYQMGDKNRPAVFILHGLLQTRNYITVRSLISAISDEGYSVLAPNLTLGISNRQKSLPCEAIHNHEMAQDIAEIDYWIQFLEKKGHSSIYLVGHSFGSLQILLYSNRKNPKSIKKLIATSLIDVEKTNDGTLIQKYIKQAQRDLKQDETQLHQYPISYCKNYTSPAKYYISYAQWTKQKIKAEINKLTTPITIILGSKDKRVDKNWISILSDSNLIIIEGANHFFDTTHEFDLNDKVLNELLTN